MTGIPDFTTVQLGPAPGPSDDREAWADRVRSEVGRTPADLANETPEGLVVAPLSSASAFISSTSEVYPAPAPSSGATGSMTVVASSEPTEHSPAGVSTDPEAAGVIFA